MLIPLVLVALVAIGILGLFITFSGTSEYNQTVSAAYRWRADAHNQAILEEALAVLYDRLNRPFDDNPENDETEGRQAPLWHNHVFETIKSAVDSGVEGEIAFAAEYLDLSKAIPRSTELVTEEDGLIEECSIRYEGFRKIVFTPEGKWVDGDEPYYRREELESNPIDVPIHYQGYVTIRITSLCGLRDRGPQIRRTLESTHDIKILNQAPMARYFVAWQSNSTKVNPEDENSELMPAQQDDLRQGGGLKIYPEGARVMAVGPYQVDTFGWTNGTGGRTRPTASDSYLSFTGSPSNIWHGWSTIPSLRAGPIQASLFGSPSPARPQKTTDFKIGLFDDILDTFTFGAWDSNVVDPGYAILYKPLTYYCANEPISKQDNGFSLIGEPSQSLAAYSDLSGSAFSGLFFRCEGEDIKEQGTVLVDSGSYPNFSVGDKETLLISPEVNIKSMCNKVDYSSWEFMGLAGYELNLSGAPIKYPYGLFYMKDIKEPPLAVLGRVLLQMAMFAGSVVVGGALGGAWGFGQTVQRILVGVAVTGLVGGLMTLFKPETITASGESEAPPANCFPSNYCYEPMRLVTRFYENLNEIPTFQNPPEEADGVRRRVLHLDGNLCVFDMENTGSFYYKGKGSIIIKPEEAEQDVTVEGPVFKRTAHAVAGDMIVNVNDHLNIRCAVSDNSSAANSEAKEQMVIKLSDGVSDPDASPMIEASVFSPHGVRPDDDTTAWIVGNLICGYFNKRKIKDTSKLRVIYDRAFKSYALTANEAGWNNICLSFRPTSWRQLKGPKP